jgi:hypothetical protein
VVLERLEGSAPDTFRICRYMHSSELGSGRGEVFPEYHIDGNSIDGPAGPFTFHDSMIADRDLRPDKLTAMGVHDSHFTVLVRAYLSEHPQSFWPDADESLATLSFDGEPELIANTDSFEHILGERDLELGPHDYDKPWHIDPDESDMMQSLARAVVSRDPSLFTPGTPNTNWRLHAHFPPEAS